MNHLEQVRTILNQHGITNEMLTIELAILVAEAEKAQILKAMA